MMKNQCKKVYEVFNILMQHLSKTMISVQSRAAQLIDFLIVITIMNTTIP